MATLSHHHLKKDGVGAVGIAGPTAVVAGILQGAKLQDGVGEADVALLQYCLKDGGVEGGIVYRDAIPEPDNVQSRNPIAHAGESEARAIVCSDLSLRVYDYLSRNTCVHESWVGMQ